MVVHSSLLLISCAPVFLLRLFCFREREPFVNFLSSHNLLWPKVNRDVNRVTLGVDLHHCDQGKRDTSSETWQRNWKYGSEYGRMSSTFVKSKISLWIVTNFRQEWIVCCVCASWPTKPHKWDRRWILSRVSSSEPQLILPSIARDPVSKRTEAWLLLVFHGFCCTALQGFTLFCRFTEFPTRTVLWEEASESISSCGILLGRKGNGPFKASGVLSKTCASSFLFERNVLFPAGFGVWRLLSSETPWDFCCSSTCAMNSRSWTSATGLLNCRHTPTVKIQTLFSAATSATWKIKEPLKMRRSRNWQKSTGKCQKLSSDVGFTHAGSCEIARRLLVEKKSCVTEPERLCARSFMISAV